MTEAEYAQLVGFRGLPIYAEGDLRCESIDRQRDPAFTGEVYEVQSVEEARESAGDPTLVPKGAIRYSDGKDSTVRVYFWKRR